MFVGGGIFRLFNKIMDISRYGDGFVFKFFFFVWFFKGLCLFYIGEIVFKKFDVLFVVVNYLNKF